MAKETVRRQSHLRAVCEEDTVGSLHVYMLPEGIIAMYIWVQCE